LLRDAGPAQKYFASPEAKMAWLQARAWVRASHLASQKSSDSVAATSFWPTGAKRSQESFLVIAASKPLDAYRLSRSNQAVARESIEALIPQLIQSANDLNAPELTGLALFNAFNHLSNLREDREFNGLIAAVVAKDRPEFSFYAGRTGEVLNNLLTNRSSPIPIEDGIEIKDDQTRIPLIVSLDKKQSPLPKGTVIDSDAKATLEAKLFDRLNEVKAGDIVVISGSLAPGLDDGYYAQLGAKPRKIKGIKVIIDTKGKPAEAVIKQEAATHISMNQFEFGELYKIHHQNINGLVAKAQEIINASPEDTGIQEIIITLGADGAMAVTRDRYWLASAPEVTAVSEIGAGDTRLAEWVYQIWREKVSPEEAFTYSIAATSASVTHPGTGEGIRNRVEGEIDTLLEKINLAEKVLRENPLATGTLPTSKIISKLTALDTPSGLPLNVPVHIAVLLTSQGFTGQLYKILLEGIDEASAVTLSRSAAEGKTTFVLDVLHARARTELELMAHGGHSEKGTFTLRAGRTLGLGSGFFTSTLYEILDLLKCAGNISRGQKNAPGSSIYLAGPLAKALGPMPDECRANMVVYSLPNGFDEKATVDPNLPLMTILRAAAQANGVKLTDLEVFMMDRERQQEERGLLHQNRIPHTLIKDGSHDAVLLAMSGLRPNNHLPVFFGSCGLTEASANYLEALTLPGVAVGMRVLGDLSSSVGDAVLSFTKTLGELNDREMAAASKAIPEEVLKALPQDVPIASLFTPEAAANLSKLRPFDANDILAGNRLFARETLTLPTERDPFIRLRNNAGEAIELINATWDSNLLTGVTTFILGSPLLRIPGVGTIYDNEHYQVSSLVIARVDGTTRVWLEPTTVSLTELKQRFPLAFR